MTPEEQKVADAAAAEAKEAEEAAKAEKENADFEASLEGLSDEEKAAKIAEKEGGVDKHKIDYEAELKAEQERADKAEKALAATRFKDAEKKRKADEAAEAGDSDDDKPVTRKELAAITAKARQEAQADQALEMAKGIAETPVEAKLIVAKWKGRSFPEGTPLSEQIEEMYAVVHRKRLIGERNEALRALKGKAGANNNSAASHAEGLPGTTPKLSPQDEQAYKGAGFVFNGVARRWEKKLPNGDILVKDSKTKVTSLVKKAK